MKKKYFKIIVALLAVFSCSSDDSEVINGVDGINGVDVPMGEMVLE